MSVCKSAMRCTETSQVVCQRKSDLVNFRVYSGNQLEGLTWPFLGRNCKVLGWFQALRGLNITSKRQKKIYPVINHHLPERFSVVPVLHWRVDFQPAAAAALVLPPGAACGVRPGSVYAPPVRGWLYPLLPCRPVTVGPAGGSGVEYWSAVNGPAILILFLLYLSNTIIRVRKYLKSANLVSK